MWKLGEACKHDQRHSAFLIDSMSSSRAIENLIAKYAELVDQGNFAGVGDLLSDATFIGSKAPVRGSVAIEQMLRDTVITYEDGTPRTKHVTTNTIIDVDEERQRAEARSYLMVLQAVPGLTLQLIVAGRYHDSFKRNNGRWGFAERRITIDLVGDVSHHLRRTAPEQST